ncbi:hypothetical protein [Limnohabitans sp. WS1]|uniref:hypothetical protein n=1 Tax=Limnohabitans sp. WS1 TaxID=1100726 RepID=UPI000D38784E|nr:hypothetical protein [Limnohabitans sp. WS1]
MKLPPTKRKTVELPSQTVFQTTRDAPLVPNDYHPTLVKLATLAALLMVQLAGGVALVGFWVWRSVSA